jgi:hypothetical protein
VGQVVTSRKAEGVVSYARCTYPRTFGGLGGRCVVFLESNMRSSLHFHTQSPHNKLPYTNLVVLLPSILRLAIQSCGHRVIMMM